MLAWLRTVLTNSLGNRHGPKEPGACSLWSRSYSLLRPLLLTCSFPP